MPGKSRHGKGKKKRAKQRPAIAAVQQQAVAQSPKAAAPAATPAPSVRMSTPPPKTTVVRYPYITAELRRIGILAGIMFAILIVLAVVLS